MIHKIIRPSIKIVIISREYNGQFMIGADREAHWHSRARASAAASPMATARGSGYRKD